MNLPMGAWPENPNADPMELALGELCEESGYHAKNTKYIGFNYVENGVYTQG